MDKPDTLPTPSSEWVVAGDRCRQPFSGWTGTVLKVVPVQSCPHVVVRWDNNGHTGRVLITTVRKLS